MGGVLSGSSLRIGSLTGARRAQPNAEVRRERTLELGALRGLLEKTRTLRERLDDLREAVGQGAVLRTRPGRAAEITGGSVVDLDVPGTRATLQSTAEANTVATSFSPRAPDFAGSSTVTPTVGGTYAGTADETLTFRVTRGGTIGGIVPLRITVQNESGQTLQQINIPGLSSPGATYTLSNGLELELSAGSLVNGDTFTVDVSATVGTDVDPDDPFDGTGNANPELQPGSAIGAGSFLLNGTAIDVFASDSLADVLERIGQSEAGVLGSYDADQDRVILEAKDEGAAGAIQLGADTSGFLAAFKLDGAQQVDGTNGGLDRLIAEVPELAAVVAGELTVNGQTIDVDPSTTSLSDLLGLFAGVGVTARWNDAGRMVLTSGRAGSSLQIGADSTGLLEALDIDQGTTEGSAARRVGGFAGRRSREVERAASRLAESLESLFADLPESLKSLISSGKSDLRGALAGLATEQLGVEGSTSRRNASDFGVVLDLRSTATRSFDVDSQQLGRALARGDGDAMSFFAAGLRPGEREKGLIVRLEEALTKIDSRVETRAGFLGGLLDRRV